MHVHTPRPSFVCKNIPETHNPPTQSVARSVRFVWMISNRSWHRSVQFTLCAVFPVKKMGRPQQKCKSASPFAAERSELQFSVRFAFSAPTGNVRPAISRTNLQFINTVVMCMPAFSCMLTLYVPSANPISAGMNKWLESLNNNKGKR